MTKQYTIITTFLFLIATHSANAMSEPKTTTDLPIETLVENFNNFTPQEQLHHKKTRAKYCFLYEFPQAAEYRFVYDFPKKTVNFKPNTHTPKRRWTHVTFHRDQKSGKLTPIHNEYQRTTQFRLQ